MLRNNQLNKPGTLVHYRNRDWMVLPTQDEDLMMLKPLGGSEEETTAIYLPLEINEERPTSTSLPEITSDSIGSFETAKLLFDASRLSFRNASGPFRCMGKLSFRPRSYQLVPLVMALKQEVTRLLIADDVGIGKTVEALIILKELMERGDVKRFAVLCPPHLCEQWAHELKDKLDVDAEIIRSSTAARLDRTIPDDRSVFYHIPYQVISIDYIKNDKRLGIFTSDCPEFVIVDEAHTCALPEGSSSKNQQLRHRVLSHLSENPNRHLLFLTATPHSGKDAEFLSLLGLIKNKFSAFNLENPEPKAKQELALHFIQRKRENIKRWLEEETTFPERESKEIGYNLSPDYYLFFQNVLRFAKGISIKESDNKQTKLLRSWAAVALIRGVMSSPAMAQNMLLKRTEKVIDDLDAETIPEPKDELFEKLNLAEDEVKSDLIDALPLENDELKDLVALRKEAELLGRLEKDYKLQTCVNLVEKWVKEGDFPIVFCKFIATANYVAEFLKQQLPNKVHVEVITSDLADEQRREKIDLMGKSEKRVLVATDCLSEGINLQDHFTAIVHYDLPWNPNRIEQREGRVDRFGQAAKTVKTYLIHGLDNPMDEFLMEVLIKKVKEIQKSIGVTIAIGEDSENLMTQAAQKLLFQEQKEGKQTTLFAKETIENEIEKAKEKGKKLRSIFAQESIDPKDIKKDLEEVDEAIGDLETVEHFVIQSLTYLGGICRKVDGGYVISSDNLPAHLKTHFENNNNSKISFLSPTPRGFRYVGRNHLVVEQLCHYMLSLAFEKNAEYASIARFSEIVTDAVDLTTTLVMFRVRNVIKEVRAKNDVISEEMYLWGYSGHDANFRTLGYDEAKNLLIEAKSLSQLSTERQEEDLKRELARFETLKNKFLEVATQRADNLVEAHQRFKTLVGGRRYEKATPVLPPDVLGVYILKPQPKQL